MSFEEPRTNPSVSGDSAPQPGQPVEGRSVPTVGMRNEQVQSADDEFQNINEQPESANEELTTVNRNAELSRLNNDLVNIQTSAHLSIVLLARDRTIRWFSSQAAKEFYLLPTDLGRPFSQVRHNLVFHERRCQSAASYSTLCPEGGRRSTDRQVLESAGHGSEITASASTIESVIDVVIGSVRECEREVRDGEGRWYSLRVRPYVTLDDRVEGAVLVLVNITDLKRTEQIIAAERDYVEAILETTRDPLLILDANLRVHTASPAFYNTFRVSSAESKGRLIYELGNRQWDIPKLRQLLEEILPRNSFFNNFEVRHDFERIGRRTMLLNARRLNDICGRPAQILLGIEDVTEALSENAKKFKLLFDRSPLPKWLVDLETLRFLDVNETAIGHYGYSREEFLRMSVLDVRTPEAGKALQAALAPPPYHPPERDRCQHRKKNGEIIDVEIHSSEISFGGKDVWLVSVSDITERKRAEEALRRAVEFDQAVTANMGEGLYTVDAQGLVTSMNPAAEKLFGWTLEELRGKRMHDMTHYMHPDGRPFPPEECAGFRVLKEGKRLADQEDVFIRKDGAFFDVVYSSSPLYEGDSLTGLVVVFRDVSERKRAEEALRKSEQRFSQFMRHLPGLAWIKDAQGRYVYANETAEKVFGTREVNIYGKTDEELFPKETAAQFTRNDRQALASESGIQTIESLQQSDGIVHHAMVSKFPIPSGGDGAGIMVGGVAFDITERKQAEEALRESEERFRLLADTAPVLIWVNGLEGCEFVNREYLQFLGRTMKEVQGMDWTAALHPDDAAAYLEAYREAFEEETPFEAQFRFRRKDGEYRWMKSAGLPRFAANGRFLGVVGCSLDITDIKRSEEALAEADRRKNEFLAMLAHELRNPLAPIRNALEILRLSQVGDECPVTKSEKDDLISKAASSRVTSQDLTTAIEMMDRQINQMVRLVDDLLDVSRISRGQIQLRTGPIDLSSLVNHAVETVRPLCESKGLNLTVALPPEPVFLNADPIRLAQVVGNILSNACKFTNPGGSIELMASVEGRVGGEKKEEGDNGDETLSTSRVSGDAGRQLATDSSSLVTISVRDNGIGIAADQLPRIFEMFAQIDTSLERTRSGLGIGLTLAKKLVELHGGELEGRSAGLGQGSEFVVRLPVVDWRVASEEKAQPDGDTLSTLHPPPATKRRILIVDDNVDSAESLTILLGLEGNETHTAYDGLDALAAAASFRPDVILLDIGLPELNGYDVARRIREQPWGRHIMLVALTGWGQEEDRRRSHEAGFDYHLTKPVDPMSLKELLQGGGSS